MQVDRLILGCNALSTLPTRRAAFRLLEAAVACGIHHFDTARNYGRGFSERVLGEFLARQGDALRVTTKSGPPRHSLDFLPTFIALPLNSQRKRSIARAPSEPRLAPTRPITRDELEKSVDASLRHLRRSWIDVLLLHEGLPSQLDDHAREFVTTLRSQGIVRKFGIGTARMIIENHYVEDPVCEVLQYDCPLSAPHTLMQRFTGVLHIHHSIFRDSPTRSHADVVRDAVNANPNGQIVFGTRSSDHLRANLAALS